MEELVPAVDGRIVATLGKQGDKVAKGEIVAFVEGAADAAVQLVPPVQPVPLAQPGMQAQPVPLAQPTMQVQPVPLAQPPSNEYSKRIENCLSGHFSRLSDRRNFNRFDKFRGRKSDLP